MREGFIKDFAGIAVIISVIGVVVFLALMAFFVLKVALSAVIG